MSATGANTQQWSGPGIMLSFIYFRKGSQLSQETFWKWFDEVYVPAVVGTGIVKSAWRWKAANPDYQKLHMVLYKVPELSTAQTDALKNIPRTSDTFPTNGPVDDFIDFESRIFSLVQYFETEKQPEDATTTIIFAGMQPASGDEADLDAWYREEHNQQMSKQPGWKRTTRFNLLFQMRNDGNPPRGLDFLAIHEFGDGHKIGKDVEPLEPMTDWTKRCMSECKAIDAAVYHKVKTFGKAAEGA